MLFEQLDDLLGRRRIGEAVAINCTLRREFGYAIQWRPVVAEVAATPSGETTSGAVQTPDPEMTRAVGGYHPSDGPLGSQCGSPRPQPERPPVTDYRGPSVDGILP